MTIASFDDLYLAYIARGKLEAAGISCFLTNEHLVGVNCLFANAVKGVDLTVWESDAAIARELLAGAVSRTDISTEDKALAPDLEEALFEPEFVCPRCGSSDIAKFSLRRPLLVVSSLFGLPLKSRKSICRCRVCSHLWRE